MTGQCWVYLFNYSDPEPGIQTSSEIRWYREQPKSGLDCPPLVSCRKNGNEAVAAQSSDLSTPGRL